MKPNKTTDIKPLLNINHFWQCQSDEQISVCNGDEEFLISNDVLRSYHADFPDRLRHMLAFYASIYGAHEANGFDVDVTLNYLLHGPITLLVDNSPLVFSSIYKLEHSTIKPGHVYTEGHLVRLVDYEYQGQAVKVIVTDNYVRQQIPRTAFDEAYPGWDKRLDVALSLNLDRDDMFFKVFHVNNKMQSAMPFDMTNIEFGS